MGALCDSHTHFKELPLPAFSNRCQETTLSLGRPPADVSVAETPKRSHWDQAPVTSEAPVPMTPIIMNVPGFVVEGKHNCYLSDEELEAILPSTGHATVSHCHAPSGLRSPHCSHPRIVDDTRIGTGRLSYPRWIGCCSGCGRRRSRSRIVYGEPRRRQHCLLQGGRCSVFRQDPERRRRNAAKRR
jgi:hypothetical protein